MDTILFGLHMDALDKKCLPYGWRPANLARAADREIGAAARRFVTDMMAADGASKAGTPDRPRPISPTWPAATPSMTGPHPRTSSAS
ncbi:MAG: hypothetical protein HOV87_12740 [Catenulispora sp.]|nr:hypothetical protein [Catenulispora sp.]